MIYLKPGIRVTEASLIEAAERVALSCARGPVQMATVIEIVKTGEVTIKKTSAPFVTSGFVTSFGPHNLPWSSWSPLSTRLKAGGFTFEACTRPIEKTRGRRYQEYLRVYYGTGDISEPVGDVPPEALTEDIPKIDLGEVPF